MHLLRRFLSSALAASLVTMPLYAAPKDNGASLSGNQIRHVLLISVDGMHALDVANSLQPIRPRPWPSSADMASLTQMPARRLILIPSRAC